MHGIVPIAMMGYYQYLNIFGITSLYIKLRDMLLIVTLKRKDSPLLSENLNLLRAFDRIKKREL